MLFHNTLPVQTRTGYHISTLQEAICLRSKNLLGSSVQWAAQPAEQVFREAFCSALSKLNQVPLRTANSISLGRQCQSFILFKSRLWGLPCSPLKWLLKPLCLCVTFIDILFIPHLQHLPKKQICGVSAKKKRNLDLAQFHASSLYS